MNIRHCGTSVRLFEGSHDEDIVSGSSHVKSSAPSVPQCRNWSSFVLPQKIAFLLPESHLLLRPPDRSLRCHARACLVVTVNLFFKPIIPAEIKYFVCVPTKIQFACFFLFFSGPSMMGARGLRCCIAHCYSIALLRRDPVCGALWVTCTLCCTVSY